MTLNNFISLIKNPQIIDEGYINDLKELIDYYPYLTQARILLSKALLDSKNVHADNFIQNTSLHCSDRRWLYYYLFADKKINTETLKFDRIPKYSGNYFDIITKIESEGNDSKQSLKDLAERLKSARTMMTQKNKAEQNQITNRNISNEEIPTLAPVEYIDLNENMTVQKGEITEELAKKMISEKKFSEAIEILKKLNLINPKKSVYFADQIRFLEKVIVNSKK
jgi:hypothetical protein